MNRNKRFLALLLFTVMSCFLTACSGVEPDYRDNGKEEGSTVVEKLTLDEIWQTWDSVLKASYNNVQLDSSIKLEKPEEIGPMTFVQAELTDREIGRIYDDLVPDMKKKYYSYEKNTIPPGPEYNDPDTGLHLGVGTNGFISYIKNDKVGEGNSEETIFLDREYEDRTFHLRDGEISLSRAAELAEELENRWEKIVKNVYSHRLRKVEVCPSEQSSNIKELVFHFEKCYKGVNILTTRRTTESGDEKPLNVDYIPCYDDMVTVSSVKEAEGLNSNAGIVKLKTETKSDKIISLQSAIQLFSDEMAGYHVNEVKKIELSYRLCNEKGESCRHLAGDEYKASPCWVFWMSEGNYTEEFAMVDCDTGKVDYIKN